MVSGMPFLTDAHPSIVSLERIDYYYKMLQFNLQRVSISMLFGSNRVLDTLLLVSFAAGLFVLCARTCRKKLHGIFSSVIHSFLVWKYPIRSISSDQPIPTCPYQWPNGQGDIGKFLEGEENSEKWGMRYGRVYRLWSGMTSEVVLRDPADVKTVFWDSDKHIKAVNNDAGWLMGELLGQCVGLISGQRYHKLRTVVNPPFTHKKALTRHNHIIGATKAYMDDLFSSGKLQHNLINPVADLKYLPFWIMVEMLYGKLSPELKNDLENLIPLRDSLWGHIIQGGAARYSLTKRLLFNVTEDLRVFKHKWALFNEAACEAAKDTVEEPAIVSMYMEVKSGTILKEELLQTLDEMLFANLDVTMGGLSWPLLFLAADSHVQDQLRQEIRATREIDTTGSGWEAYLQSSSTLLAASILEASRLKPLAAFTVPQAAPTDRIVSGFLVPAGTNYIVDTHALNTKNTYWGHDKKDRETYRPSRFLDRKQSEMRYQFWRFGFGPRQCLGKYVVDIVLRAVVAFLVENFQLGLSEKTHWGKNPSTWILHPDTEILCERLDEH
ncbi:putative cytochrome P450 monooxygenase [Xylaria palmicola]|nr:putative cytochrome P450 monooxygenase [Xylaria palmicola]